MRPTYSHLVARARQVIAVLLVSISLSAENFSADSIMLAAYEREDMSVWKEYVDSENLSPLTDNRLSYEYGFCGYIVAEAKKSGNEALMEQAKQYVARFKSDILNLKSKMPIGHYEMYLSAVYVYELRLHLSIHPVKAMSLAKEAVKKAPSDPVVLSYYGTCLFYAPSPFGSKSEALEWFRKAKPLFRDKRWQYSWLRVANDMYIRQCEQKLQKN